MSKIEYEIRKDGNPYIQVAESESELLETFMIIGDYQYIQKAMHEENYELKNLLSFVFKEILFENKVVGFATYDIRNNYELIMTECYILPEFRGKRLFFDEICKMHFAAPRFGILQPTRNVIELLVDYAFAKNVTDDIIASAVDLYLNPFDVKSNKNDGLLLLQLPSSNFYDASICSTLFVHEDEVFYHELLENDKKRDNHRKKLDEGYFDKIVKLFSKNNDEFEKFILELKDELPDNKLGFDVLVGFGDGLSEYMQGMVDVDIISYERAIAIRNQLIDEYESGEIDDNNIEDRFNTLSLSREVIIKDFNDLKDLVNSDQLNDDAGFFKDLVTIVGDNSQLGDELFNALLNGNEVEFHRVMLNHLEHDEVFFENLNNVLDENFDNEKYSPELFENFTYIFTDDFDFDELKEKSEKFVKESIDNKYNLNDCCDEINSLKYEKEFYLILDALNKGNNYYDALGFVEYESLVQPELLTKALLNSKFIEKDGIIEIDWINDASGVDNIELRKILDSNNLDFKGNRQECLQYLSDNNVSLGDAFKITSNGKEFLKEFYWIGFYWDFLDDFDFDDYCRYIDNHKGSLKDVSLDYLDEHIKLARKSADEDYLDDCLFYKGDILEEADGFLRELISLD